jgi:hypothetical protein
MFSFEGWSSTGKILPFLIVKAMILIQIRIDVKFGSRSALKPVQIPNKTGNTPNRNLNFKKHILFNSCLYLCRNLRTEGKRADAPVLQVEQHHQPCQPQEILRHRVPELRIQVLKNGPPRRTPSYEIIGSLARFRGRRLLLPLAKKNSRKTKSLGGTRYFYHELFCNQG